MWLLIIFMKTVLIGAGNLATNLGKALSKAGHDICQVYSRTMASASALAETLHCEATDDLQQVKNDAEVYILSIKDSVLSDVAAKLCHGREDAVFLHTAGSMPMDLFKGLARHYGVIYPMQTFSKTREVDFSIIPTFIEHNDDKAGQVVRTLAGSITGRVYPLASADRKYLHLSAVWACNFVNHCYDISSQLLASHGIPFDVMLPLIDETARKVHTLPPHEAQTGPAVRYDENVINAQIQLMAKAPLLQQIYRLLSVHIHETHL